MVGNAMTICRYRPAFFSGFEDESAEVNSVAELLAVPWIAHWATLPCFKQFSYHVDPPVEPPGKRVRQGFLMGDFEHESGRSWNVVVIFHEHPEWLRELPPSPKYGELAKACARCKRP